MLGTFEPRKGHKFVLDAFRKVVDRIPDTHLICAGYGSKKEIGYINKLVNEFSLNDNVHILKFREDKENLLSQTDILIIGSQAYESFGYTAIEAMSYQVPVIATNVGGLPEVVINGEGGYCLDNNDAESYANKIVELLNDESIRISQGRKGYFRYKKYFTAKRMATEYSMLIKEKGSV
jgi:glycosyltransferase involved in cell wall biosynthesis